MGGVIYSLQQIIDGEVSRQAVGGKADGLARLQAMGLPVPPAFVICEATAKDYPDNLDEHYRELNCDFVAARSSAQGEDGAEASFAGQYESVLNVADGNALRQAIDLCVESANTDRAKSYQEAQFDAQLATMNVVVQRMVDAETAGVVFTADPLSARRDLLIIDAVAGLGEALVSGEATPDHYAVNRAGELVHKQLTGESPLLSDQQIQKIAEQARAAAAHEAQPLDLEWAIDKSGELFWLQARPITTLPSDLNEFDTVLPRPDDVLTISNVSEMMPGAVCPLTMSFTGWGIDYGLQHMQVAVGARGFIDKNWQVTASAYGHLFLNMTGNVVMSAGVLGSTADQTAQAICGRLVPELKDLPPMPLWRRCANTLKLLKYCFAAPKVVQKFGEEMAAFQIEQKNDSAQMWNEISGKLAFFDHAMAVHIQSSALSGFYCSIVENMVSSKSNDSTVEEQSEAIRLLSGAKDVESAVMLEQLDGLVDLVAAHKDAAEKFIGVSAEQAVEWLKSNPDLEKRLSEFLRVHGHRGYRELCVRDLSWGDDLDPLVQSMQAAAQSRLISGGQKEKKNNDIEWSALSRGLRWALPKAHDAIRRREHTKSLLVKAAYQFSHAFRHLAVLLTEEKRLPDADLLFFFTSSELADLLPLGNEAEIKAMVTKALARREALSYQQRFEFPEISVGIPQPLEPQLVDVKDGVLQGRPASRGVVEGVVRVAHTLQEASVLKSGEILVTPITDIGWTPYFSMISGLVTDLGSSVSHGAVIAREYGLPCVVNTRQGTGFLKTGDRVRLDGDLGRVTLLESATI